MPRSIRQFAGVLALSAAASLSGAQEDADRVFGRVGPERPVVEIPADERAGVQPGSGGAPAWEVRSDAHVLVPPTPKPEPEPEPERQAVVEAPVQAQAEQPIAPPLEGERILVQEPVVAPAPVPTSAAEGRALGSEQPEPLGAAARAQPGAFAWVARTGAALALVLGLILVLAWLYERANRARRGVMQGGGAGGRSPAGLIEILGRYPIGPRQSLLLLKFDRRVLLLSQTAPRGGPVVTSTLCELSDPEDVASVLVKMRDSSGESLNEAFHAAMDHANRRTSAIVHPATTAAPIAPPRQTIEARPFQADYDPEDLRRTVGGTETERAQLWEDLGNDRTGRDPIGLLRRRLESMRGGAAG